MENSGCDMGLIGLGVMGRNFVLNIAGHGYSVAGFDRDTEKGRQLEGEKDTGGRVAVAYELPRFVGLLRRPRSIILLVPAGAPVDAVIGELVPILEPGDLIVDAGNSHFTDTDRRTRELLGKGLLFMGMGISGGESGARHGPSLMPGGPPEGYERMKPLLEKAAARVDGDPCVAYLGPESAGHYVKMVHNGIEYGLMQLISEAYDLMKRGLGFSCTDLHRVFDGWSRSEPASYLVEITSKIFLKLDEKTGRPLVDLILDRARQKGTGKWTSIEAMELQVPTPTIDLAVAMRDMSGFKEERVSAGQALSGPDHVFQGDRKGFLDQLKNAFFASMIITYAQGMALLRKASQAYGYDLSPEAVARIWRGGCIIRAALLEDIRAAFQARPDLPNLLADPHLGRKVADRQGDLRSIVSTAAHLGLPAPGMMGALACFDAYRSAWLPASLIQAQRDFFGSHTYERTDAEGIFHTQWEKD